MTTFTYKSPLSFLLNKKRIWHSYTCTPMNLIVSRTLEKFFFTSLSSLFFYQTSHNGTWILKTKKISTIISVVRWGVEPFLFAKGKSQVNVDHCFCSSECWTLSTYCRNHLVVQECVFTSWCTGWVPHGTVEWVWKLFVESNGEQPNQN